MAATQPEDYALIVGINKYADEYFLKTLNGPKNDVQRFIDWLKSPTGGNVPEGNVLPYRHVSDELGQTPKSGEIIETIKKLLKLSKDDKDEEVRIGRRLYIFLAGHGVCSDLDNAGLLTAEATEDSPAYVDGRRCANLFRGRAVFDEVVLIMDCCRDFDGELPDSLFPFKKKIDTGGAHKVKRFYAYATGFGRDAREKEFDKEVSGIFSHVLIEGLKGGAVDGEGRITGPSLERYVKKQMKNHLPPGTEQTADISCDSDLVFADGFPPATADVTIETTVPYHSLAIFYGDGFKPVQLVPQDLGGGKFQIQLRIGKTYVFQLLDVGGAILKEDGRAIEDVDQVINVKL